MSALRWIMVTACLACFLFLWMRGTTQLVWADDANDALRNVIIEHEKKELDCLKTGDMQRFASLIADDAVFVNPRGPAGKAEVVKNTSNVRLTEYSMEDVRFVPVSSESGIIAYKLTESGTAHGKTFSAQVYASALWVKRGGKWVCMFSQETVAR